MPDEAAPRQDGRPLETASPPPPPAADDALALAAWRRNRVPLMVDIGLGLLFFAVAKLTDLTTAALVGAAAGLVLVVVQRLTRIDLLGGLALFGIAMLLLSAGLAMAFQSDDAVKYRSSIVGLVSATLFFADGLMGGNRLAMRLRRYLPYRGIDPARLGIGLGALGATMATANFAVAELASTDVWLFYSTFADFALSMVLVMLVFRYARGEALRDLAPRYRPDPAEAALPQ
ncbi:septation protein IspZ [Qipengyuania sediminis]|uniref:septation protein IspZ n=1 Tax=Qipengyuania sediminis TaxID=1532023 RepID=UPI001059792F|nr:septation protein IspZ [Qipengyuania sediminis]